MRICLLIISSCKSYAIKLKSGDLLSKMVCSWPSIFDFWPAIWKHEHETNITSFNMFRKHNSIFESDTFCCYNKIKLHISTSRKAYFYTTTYIVLNHVGLWSKCCLSKTRDVLFVVLASNWHIQWEKMIWTAMCDTVIIHSLCKKASHIEIWPPWSFEISLKCSMYLFWLFQAQS